MAVVEEAFDLAEAGAADGESGGIISFLSVIAGAFGIIAAIFKIVL